MPVYDGAAFEFPSSRDLQLSFEGKAPAHVYSRISNPTVEDFELKVKQISGATGVVAVNSGMAAISTVILALAHAGANIVTTRYLFGNTLSFFQTTLKTWGLEVRFADMSEPETVAAAIDENTCAVFLETITNPQLEVADIDTLAVITRSRGIPLLLDGTMTTPYLFRSKEHGVAVEMISSTKYISGGATSVGGLIIDNGNYDWALHPSLKKEAIKYGPFAFLTRLRREVFRNMGTCLSPHNAYLQTLGLETMALRIDKCCSNAFGLAKHLESLNSVKNVHYPGLASSPYQATASRLFKNRYGSLLTFRLESREHCYRFMDALHLIRRATNIHDNKTLIIHPASTIFCEYQKESRDSMGVYDNMIRLSVGIEDEADLLDDINQAFENGG